MVGARRIVLKRSPLKFVIEIDRFRVGLGGPQVIARRWNPLRIGPGTMTVRLMLKVCSLAALVLLVFFALGPAKWTPRSGFGFQFDHFVGYFFFTLLFCLTWPRPLVVGGALVVLAVVLENLQSFLPGRSSYFVAALYSAAGVLAAALLAELFIRARWFQSKGAEREP
jgi:VanZ family protein